MVRVQDGSTKWVLVLGHGVAKLPECELRLSDRFAKGRKGEKPPMGGYGAASYVSWEHTQLVRRGGGRLDSTLKGMNSLEDGCNIETGFMEVSWKESDGTLVMRQEINTTGFEDESFVSGGDLSCPQSWIGLSGRTAVQGNAPVRSHDLRTSVSWS
ncbi:hypothetical protein IGI04_007373 [Brassica rapa subsp. trilocularis]|uniref:Uncharacterized protein n=1 Tax=Brassica rapa subsp. trilocularis TaxID=1813537 RepID=A0ABQ7NJN6_BRACM|nr:hypothetical protein IGI04_007373 [Brassica rapa subsp. trilocularis]